MNIKRIMFSQLGIVSQEKYDNEVKKRIKFESQYYALVGEVKGLRKVKGAKNDNRRIWASLIVNCYVVGMGLDANHNNRVCCKREERQRRNGKKKSEADCRIYFAQKGVKKKR